MYAYIQRIAGHNIIRYFHIYHSVEHVKEMTPSEARRVQTPAETYDLHQSLRILNWSSAMHGLLDQVCSNPKVWIGTQPLRLVSQSHMAHMVSGKIGSMQPNMASIVFKPIDLANTNNHFISGRSRSRSSGSARYSSDHSSSQGRVVYRYYPDSSCLIPAACASSSFPVQHTIPSSVYVLMRSLPSYFNVGEVFMLGKQLLDIR